MTKALQLARSFHRAGHRVVLVESRKYRFTGHRFSRAVAAFHTVPEPDAPGYAAALLAIVRHEGVDVYVPVCSPVASYHDAVAKRRRSRRTARCCTPTPSTSRRSTTRPRSRTPPAPSACPCPTPTASPRRQVAAFDFAAAPQLRPQEHPVQPRQPARPDPAAPRHTRRRPRVRPVQADRARTIRGSCRSSSPARSTAPTARARRQAPGVRVLRVLGVPGQLRDGGQARDRGWVRGSSSALRLTGQVSFDFIEAADGDPCHRMQPAHPFGHHHVPRPPRRGAGLPGRPPDRSHPALVGARPTYWLYHELWRLITQRGRRAAGCGMPAARTRSSTGRTRCRT